MPERCGWPVINGVGNEARLVRGDVVAEEVEWGGWGRDVVNLGCGAQC